MATKYSLYAEDMKGGTGNIVYNNEDNLPFVFPQWFMPDSVYFHRDQSGSSLTSGVGFSMGMTGDTGYFLPLLAGVTTTTLNSVSVHHKPDTPISSKDSDRNVFIYPSSNIGSGRIKIVLFASAVDYMYG